MNRTIHSSVLLLLLLALGLVLAAHRSHHPSCDTSTQTEQRMALSVMHIEIVGLSLCTTTDLPPGNE